MWLQSKDDSTGGNMSLLVNNLLALNFKQVIEKSLFQKEKAQKFFDNLEVLICERIAGQAIKKRGTMDMKDVIISLFSHFHSIKHGVNHLPPLSSPATYLSRQEKESRNTRTS
jgi:hypothetical protein